MDVEAVVAAGAPPVMAILRGVTPAEAVEVGRALVEAGVRLIEVPLNSPEPLVSIAALSGAFSGRAAIGAGTVLTPADVDAVTAAGARFVVSPNTDGALVAHARALGLEAFPGVFTPTEAFAALAAGARHLKLFPARSLGPAFVRALREVLPRGIGLWAVGGVGLETLRDWRDAGCAGVGIGGELFRPGDATAAIAAKARALAAAWA